MKMVFLCVTVVECPAPTLLYGTVSPAQENYFVGDVTRYECHSGHLHLRGSARRVCLANGKWSGKTPVCSRDSKTGRKRSKNRHSFRQK